VLILRDPLPPKAPVFWQTLQEYALLEKTLGDRFKHGSPSSVEGILEQRAFGAGKMSHTITKPELQSNLESILNDIVEVGESYVIESDGRPAVVLLSADEYAELKREWTWGVVDKLRSQNAGRDPEDIFEEVTALVESVRQERYDRSQVTKRGS
jgi:prevent-host-death family protein